MIIGMHPVAFYLALLGLLIGVAGLILGALVLLSRPTVSLGSTVDPDNPLTTEAIISNDGQLDLEDVSIENYAPTLNYQSGLTFTDFSGRKWDITRLPVGQRETVPLSSLIGGSPTPISEADIYMFLCYRPWVVPKFTWFGSPKAFRFRSKVFKDGKVRFEQQPAEPNILAKYTAHLASHGYAPCRVGQLPGFGG
jgi:hypothetical protein